MLSNKLFTSKYRPSKADNVILVPRIKNILFPNDVIDIPKNLLFTGSSGIGKSTVAKIFANTFNSYEINASKESSIDNLRAEITEFCNTSPDIFSNKRDDIKIVYLDEFDGVSNKFQEALRGFIEDYEDNVRFIATCNNISKISDAIQSRFTIIDFNCQNQEETDYVKTKLKSRISGIVQRENISMTETDIDLLINSNFPDIRKMYNKIELFNSTISSNIFDNNIDILHTLICDKTKSIEYVYTYISDNWNNTNIDNIISGLSKPFCDYIIKDNTNRIQYIPEILEFVSEYSYRAKNSTDPFVHIMALIFKIKTTIK